MPAITRSSMYGARTSGEEETSAPFDSHDENMDSDHEMISSDIEDDRAGDSGSSPLQATAQELLRPLQETADRVSRQVELFAKTLDRFISAKEEREEQDRWNSTFVLLDSYSEIASQDAKRYEPKSRGSNYSIRNRKSLGDTAAQQEKLCLESRLWTLSSELLPCKSPSLIEDNGFLKNSALAELHRYSTNQELWSAFMNVDIVASQYEAILDWLTSWKKDMTPPISDDTLDNYQNAHRGDGIWVDGNIFTQGPIKQQKRARAYPGALQPSPEIRGIHTRKLDAAAPLVTQMDPDAHTRQASVLETEDDAADASAWHACWELLRRGAAVQDSQTWWHDRRELWRSLILRNPATDPAPTQEERPQAPLGQQWLRIVNLASNRNYYDFCSDLSERDTTVNPFEKAVYGIMCGSYAASAPVCKSLDDHFFALFNDLLIERYDRFLADYRKRLEDPSIVAYNPPQSTIGEVSKYFTVAQADKSTKAETHMPHKYLQAMLMSDEIAAFLIELGHAAAKTAHLTSQSEFLFDRDDSKVNECAEIAARDEDVVRIAIHLQLALKSLGQLENAYEKDETAMENNIVNYIGVLERHAKYGLIPLYTSTLTTERQPRVLGRILAKVTEPKERDIQMRLMKQYDISVYEVIYTICDYARQTWILQCGIVENSTTPMSIIEYNDKIVRVKHNFIGHLDQSDPVARVIEAHEWVNLLDTKHWGMAVWLMTCLYKTLLLSGNIAAARELVERVELAKTSLKVTGMNLSISAVVAEEDLIGNVDIDAEIDGPEDDEPSRLASPSKRRREPKLDHPLAKETRDRSKLANQSINWAHLEYLVQALEALELWQTYADEVNDMIRTDGSRMKSAKKSLTAALQTVHHAMQPLLEHDFLTYPNDEEEAEQLERLRNRYLPECILAYNSALYFGGHAITRQYLVQCMDLAQQVAKNSSLTEAFIASKRMSELVTAFAHDSHALLRANEHSGKNARGRGGRRIVAGEPYGSTAEIWQVAWNDK